MGRHYNMQLVFFVTLIFCCEVALSQLLDLFNTKIIAKPDPGVTCKNVRECADCTTGRICGSLKGKLVQSFLLNCDGDTPYCNNGICSKIPGAKCSSPSLCPFDMPGILPHPTDCTRYITCAKQVATINQCPRNNVYDHATGTCVYRRFNNCVTFNCIWSKDKIVVYPRDNRLYALCTDAGPIILGKCKDYQKFDENQQECVRYCSQSNIGPQPPDDPDSQDTCGKYYLCAKTFPTVYELKEMLCACNEGYNETIKGCSTSATCLNDTDRCSIESPQVGKFIINNSGDNNNDNEVSNGSDDVNGNLVNGNDNGDSSDSGNVANGGPGASPLIINNSGNDNSNNNVSNGNDDVDGNIVNGNKNGDNSESGNVANNRPAPVPLSIIINNSGDKNNNNKVSNGNDSADGNLVNGNNNGDNSNSGNVANGDPARLFPLVINNSGNDNDNNKVSNGDDSVDGNLVNGNDNGDNSKSGNVQRRSVLPLIINSSGNDNSNNDVSNDSDDVDGNVVNGNKNGDNKNSGNVKNDPPPAPPPVDNSGSKDNQRDNNIPNDSENEKDGSGDVNDNNPDNNNNPDDNNNPDKSQPIEDPDKSQPIKDPRPEIRNLFRIFIDWIIRVVLGQQV